MKIFFRVLLVLILIGAIVSFGLVYFIGKSAAEGATGIAKAKKEWKEKGIDPIDTAITKATEFVESELAKDSTSIDSLKQE